MFYELEFQDDLTSTLEKGVEIVNRNFLGMSHDLGAIIEANTNPLVPFRIGNLRGSFSILAEITGNENLLQWSYSGLGSSLTGISLDSLLYNESVGSFESQDEGPNYDYAWIQNYNTAYNHRTGQAYYLEEGLEASIDDLFGLMDNRLLDGVFD